jgi:hypothetical protein
MFVRVGHHLLQQDERGGIDDAHLRVDRISLQFWYQWRCIIEKANE